MSGRVIQRVRRAVREGRWEATEHALDEAEADGFDAADIHRVLLAGSIGMVYTHDPRGARYLLRGRGAAGRAMCVVCRFTPRRDLRVITVYADEDQG